MTARRLFWASQSGIVSSRSAPFRDISNSALWWGAAAFTPAVSIDRCAVDRKQYVALQYPASAVAPPASTLRTISPRSDSIFNAVEDPSETGRNTTPRREPWCATRGGWPEGLGCGLTIGAST